MTTQVIIFNMSGVAVATDSAVTFGNGRVYDTSEKIYCLPDPHKIAVLHSGAVWMHNVTQMQLVTEWSLQLDPRGFHTVKDYARDFTRWVSGNASRWISDEAVNQSILEVVEDVFVRVHDSMHEEPLAQQRMNLDFHGTAEVCARQIKSYVGVLEEFPEPVGQTPARVFEISELLHDRISELMSHHFSDIPKTSNVMSALWDLVELAVTKSPELTNGTLAFVGFGSDQIAPAFANIDLGVVLHGALLMLPGESAEFAPGVQKYGGIEVLGQDLTIALVLQQFNNATVNFASSVVRNHLRIVAESLPLNSTTEETHGVIEALKSDSDTNTSSDFNTLFGPQTTNRIKSTIARLPLATLAEIARQLVSIEILSKTIMCEMPTVGGPIKVVTITRADGCRPCCKTADAA